MSWERSSSRYPSQTSLPLPSVSSKSSTATASSSMNNNSQSAFYPTSSSWESSKRRPSSPPHNSSAATSSGRSAMGVASIGKEDPGWDAFRRSSSRSTSSSSTALPPLRSHARDSLSSTHSSSTTTADSSYRNSTVDRWNLPTGSTYASLPPPTSASSSSSAAPASSRSYGGGWGGAGTNTAVGSLPRSGSDRTSSTSRKWESGSKSQLLPSRSSGSTASIPASTTDDALGSGSTSSWERRRDRLGDQMTGGQAPYGSNTHSSKSRVGANWGWDDRNYSSDHTSAVAPPPTVSSRARSRSPSRSPPPPHHTQFNSRHPSSSTASYQPASRRAAYPAVSSSSSSTHAHHPPSHQRYSPGRKQHAPSRRSPSPEYNTYYDRRRGREPRAEPRGKKEKKFYPSHEPERKIDRSRTKSASRSRSSSRSSIHSSRSRSRSRSASRMTKQKPSNRGADDGVGAKTSQRRWSVFSDNKSGMSSPRGRSESPPMSLEMERAWAAKDRERQRREQDPDRSFGKRDRSASPSLTASQAIIGSEVPPGPGERTHGWAASGFGGVNSIPSAPANKKGKWDRGSPAPGPPSGPRSRAGNQTGSSSGFFPPSGPAASRTSNSASSPAPAPHTTTHVFGPPPKVPLSAAEKRAQFSTGPGSLLSSSPGTAFKDPYQRTYEPSPLQAHLLSSANEKDAVPAGPKVHRPIYPPAPSRLRPRSPEEKEPVSTFRTLAPPPPPPPPPPPSLAASSEAIPAAHAQTADRGVASALDRHTVGTGVVQPIRFGLSAQLATPGEKLGGPTARVSKFFSLDDDTEKDMVNQAGERNKDSRNGSKPKGSERDLENEREIEREKREEKRKKDAMEREVDRFSESLADRDSRLPREREREGDRNRDRDHNRPREDYRDREREFRREGFHSGRPHRSQRKYDDRTEPGLIPARYREPEQEKSGRPKKREPSADPFGRAPRAYRSPSPDMEQIWRRKKPESTVPESEISSHGERDKMEVDQPAETDDRRDPSTAAASEVPSVVSTRSTSPVGSYPAYPSAQTQPASVSEPSHVSSSSLTGKPSHDDHSAPAPAAPATPFVNGSQIPPTTETYQKIAQVGEGTYGKVYKARNNETGLYVALKRIRMEGEKEGFPVTAMREIKLLQSLNHPNVVRLFEMMVSQGSCHMVFEYMDHDLTGVLSQSQYVFSPANLKSLCHQMISGLSHLHFKGVLHRDMKGSNILINSLGELKLADFGLARFYHKRRRSDYTNRVITLWYRPIELLLGATEYGAEVDMWSAGCIMLEIFTRKTTFPGADEISQLEKIYSLCGTPNEEEWPGLTDLPWYELLNKDVPPVRSRLREIFEPLLSPGAMRLAEGLLEYDPVKRTTAAEALQMDYFTTEEPPMQMPFHLAEVGGEFHELEAKRDRAKKRAKGRAEGDHRSGT
ncbi:pkinase-domain-containing protein [Phaffia rhodozyma]|uniref:cyclin-dependent kinase n=1 Tax=Phaffia rhodozyma TaxID=264483 RepID=A0A0F7SK64_PHARH|nr:pkinase-domain-containing protein [Phaffia rhodozyma]